MATISEASIMTRCRERADMVNDNFILDAELQEMVRRNASALYDKLIKARGQEYYVAPAQPLSLVQNSHNDGKIQLPVDFYQLLAVRVGGPGFTTTGTGQNTKLTAPCWRTIKPFDRQIVAHYRTMQDCGQDPQCLDEFVYRLGGADSNDSTFGYDIIQFYPVSVADRWLVEIDYIPYARVQNVGSGAANLYIDALNDWDDWIIWKTVVQMLAKGQYETNDARAELAEQEQRIKDLAGSRDAGQPERVRGRREVKTGRRRGTNTWWR